MPLEPLEIAGWALAAGALALLGWALLSDRARRRPRCPRCWYDLRAHDTSEAADPPLPITCPECGTRLTRPRQLHRRRRRWRLALLALALLIVAYELPRIPAIRARGYPAALPTTALILAADLAPLALFDPSTFKADGPFFDELDERRPLSMWQGAILNARIRFHARAAGVYDIDESGNTPDAIAVRTYNIDRHMDLTTWPFDGFRPRKSARVGTIFGGGGVPPEFPREQQFEDILMAIQTFVASDSWRDNGGTIGLAWRFDDRTLIVRQTQAAHLEIRRLLHAIEHPEPIARATPTGTDKAAVRVYDVRPIFETYPAGQRYSDLLVELEDEVTSSVDPSGWWNHGGDRSVGWIVGTSFVVCTTRENHEAIRAFLRNRLQSSPRDSE